MEFSQIRQSMNDDACNIVSALSQSTSLTLQAITLITGLHEHSTRFILEQMAVFGVVSEDNGLWQLTHGFKVSCRA
jgi:DNA-binding IclR family transcriptional regulator